MLVGLHVHRIAGSIMQLIIEEMKTLREEENHSFERGTLDLWYMFKILLAIECVTIIITSFF